MPAPPQPLERLAAARPPLACSGLGDGLGDGAASLVRGGLTGCLNRRVARPAVGQELGDGFVEWHQPCIAMPNLAGLGAPGYRPERLAAARSAAARDHRGSGVRRRRCPLAHRAARPLLGGRRWRRFALGHGDEREFFLRQRHGELGMVVMRLADLEPPVLTQGSHSLQHCYIAHFLGGGVAHGQLAEVFGHHHQLVHGESTAVAGVRRSARIRPGRRTQE